MLNTHLQRCPEFLAGDHTRLRELLHPAKASLALGYSLAHGLLAPGQQSLWHRLKSSEVYYFIAGRGGMKVPRLSFSAWSIQPGPRRMRPLVDSREEICT